MQINVMSSDPGITPGDPLPEKNDQEHEHMRTKDTDYPSSPPASLPHDAQSSLLEKAQTMNDVEAAHQLMLDMGTIRNSRKNYTSQNTLNLSISSSQGKLRLSSLLDKDMGGDIGKRIKDRKKKKNKKSDGLTSTLTEPGNDIG